MKYIISFLFLITVLSCQEEKETNFFFEELSATYTGINFSNKLLDTQEFNILEYLYFYNGAGISVADFNNDGLEDLYIGSNQGKDQIYFNKGNFRFENVSDRFSAESLEGWTTGINVIDVNEDGWMDIYVCRLGNYKSYKDTNKLFINQGGKEFVESAAVYGLDFSGFSTQAAFLDYDRDGDLDCYLLNHSVKDPDQFKKSEIRLTVDSLAGDRFLENVDQKFVDVTEASNIYSSSIGFGLGISIADINDDNWPDIYVSNDFHEQDYLYLNKGDKTFEEQIQNATSHTSNFSMGTAVADLNNDLKFDIITLDMKPFDDVIYKKSGGWESAQIYNFKRSFGYHHQSPRNAFQMNQGLSNGIPQFSEQAALFETAATDWSWSPLVADFDNDGDQDIYITNGIVKRPNDIDFINFKYEPNAKNKLGLLIDIPSGGIENVYFENLGIDKGYKKELSQIKTVSNAAVISDLDLDGYPDLIVSHLNKGISILKNCHFVAHSYLLIKLLGDKSNPEAIGAKVILYTNQNKQIRHVQSTDGFMSHSTSIIHFGLGKSKIDSLLVIWPTGEKQKVLNPTTNSVLEIKKTIQIVQEPNAANSLNDNCKVVNLDFTNPKEDSNWQGLNKWALFNSNSWAADLEPQGQDILISEPGGKMLATINQKDEIFHTDNKDLMTTQLRALLENQKINYLTSADFDNDGDLDYFIHFENKSALFIYDKDNYKILDLPNYQDIKVAAWADINGDNKKQLVVAGFWMPIQIVSINEDELMLENLPNSSGLWSALYIEDLDSDGKKDIIAGNFGLNHGLRASEKEPLRSYRNDFDRNGSTETLITYYANGKEVPYPNQALFVSQLPAAKKKYLKASDYVEADIKALLPTKTYKTAEQRVVNQLASSYFLQSENSWQQNPLPQNLQVAPIYAIEKVKDSKYCFGGNLFDVDPNLGRQDASVLSIYTYSEGNWLKSNVSDAFCPIKGEVRDILYNNEKLYLSMRGDSIKVVYLNQ